MPALYSQIKRNIAKAARNTKFTGEKPSKMLYLGVGLIALCKDLLDLVMIGSLPGIGTIVTFCFTFLIWILLTVFDRSGAKANRKIVQGLVITLLGLVEAIGFGLNFFPIQTGTIALLFILANRTYRKEKKEWDDQEKERQKKEGRIRARQIALERAQEMELERAQEARLAEERLRQTHEPNTSARPVPTTEPRTFPQKAMDGARGERNRVNSRPQTVYNTNKNFK